MAFFSWLNIHSYDGRQAQFPGEVFLRFLDKPVGQNEQLAVIKELEQSENIISKLDPNFPDAFTVNQLFEVLARNGL